MKTKINFKVSLVVMMMFISGIALSQEKPIRIGVKIGYPNLIGGHVEYVTPLLENRLAGSIEYSSLSASSVLDPDDGKFSYFELGANYYFFKEGKGLYGTLSYGILDADLDLMEIESNTTDGKFGQGSVSLKNKSMNVKSWRKVGWWFLFQT